MHQYLSFDTNIAYIGALLQIFHFLPMADGGHFENGPWKVMPKGVKLTLFRNDVQGTYRTR